MPGPETDSLDFDFELTDSLDNSSPKSALSFGVSKVNENGVDEEQLIRQAEVVFDKGTPDFADFVSKRTPEELYVLQDWSERRGHSMISGMIKNLICTPQQYAFKVEECQKHEVLLKEKGKQSAKTYEMKLYEESTKKQQILSRLSNEINLLMEKLKATKQEYENVEKSANHSIAGIEQESKLERERLNNQLVIVKKSYEYIRTAQKTFLEKFISQPEMYNADSVALALQMLCIPIDRHVFLEANVDGSSLASMSPEEIDQFLNKAVPFEGSRIRLRYLTEVMNNSKLLTDVIIPHEGAELPSDVRFFNNEHVLTFLRNSGVNSNNFLRALDLPGDTDILECFKRHMVTGEVLMRLDSVQIARIVTKANNVGKAKKLVTKLRGLAENYRGIF